MGGSQYGCFRPGRRGAADAVRWGQWLSESAPLAAGGRDYWPPGPLRAQALKLRPQVWLRPCC
eukprot:5145342-Alexandrium_andersonii.AAC.1